MTDAAQQELTRLVASVLERMSGTKVEAAREIGVDPSNLSDITRGRQRPSLRVARGLVAVLEGWRARCERDRELLAQALARCEEQELATEEVHHE